MIRKMKERKKLRNSRNSMDETERGRKRNHKQVPETKSIVLTWLEVVMDDRWLDFVQVFKSADRLNNDRPCFLLRNQFILLQVEVKVVALTVF